MINDLPRLVREFKPRFPDDINGMSPIEHARFILEETALDRFHESVAIKMLDDFEIKAEAAPAAVADVQRLLARSQDREADAPLP